MKRRKGRKQMNGQVTLIQDLEIQPSQQGSGKVWASGDGGGGGLPSARGQGEGVKICGRGADRGQTDGRWLTGVQRKPKERRVSQRKVFRWVHI